MENGSHTSFCTGPTAAMPSLRSSFESVLSLSARPVGEGNTEPRPFSSCRARSRISTARGDSGTRCSSFAFMRSAGAVQLAISASTSCHRAPMPPAITRRAQFGPSSQSGPSDTSGWQASHQPQCPLYAIQVGCSRRDSATLGSWSALKRQSLRESRGGSMPYNQPYRGCGHNRNFAT